MSASCLVVNCHYYSLSAATKPQRIYFRGLAVAVTLLALVHIITAKSAFIPDPMFARRCPHIITVRHTTTINLLDEGFIWTLGQTLAFVKIPV